MRDVAPRWSMSCAACSPSPSGTHASRDYFSRAILTASSRSTRSTTAGPFVSRRRSRRSWPVGEVSRDVEPAGMVGFYLFGSVPEPFTLYRDIRALAAGHTQWIDAAGPQQPKPYVKLAEILARWRPQTKSAGRTRTAASQLRARQRSGASVGRRRGRPISLRRSGFRGAAWLDARCRPARYPCHHAGVR